MSKCQNTSKPRQPKLRASCDGCFLAKVKCSKERPICSRCLTTGAECGYSPSCRTGKSKSTNPGMDQRPSNSSLENLYEEPAVTYTTLSQDMSYPEEPPPFASNPGWSPMPPQPQPDHRFHRRSISTSTAPPMIRDPSSTPESISNTATMEAFDPQFQFPQGMRGPGSSSFHSMRSKSMAEIPAFPPMEPYFEGGQPDVMMFGQMPGMGQFQKDVYQPNEMIANPSTCNCFDNSLQALQALHQHTANNIQSPSFDVVLVVNRRAVESCAIMLDCPKCITGGNGNSNTSTMLLATIVGKVTSFYRAASQNYFGFTSQNQYQPQQLSLTIGAYKIAEEDGRWLEMEILLRELRKLEDVLGKFQDVVSKDEMEEHGGVQNAVLSYLRQSLNVTFEVLNMRRNMPQSSRG
ncbi:TrN [Glarea lozoyensis ATCC 20868]|uniref:TrN n=2 Tax=Glarea lozoyensis TaxID=101852 RepID=S3DCT0_GLAL2|nr:TrN [Glarea lozoyensis ATCC 20868]AAN59954.1 unknown [Glarea lozoyensis]EPE34889.1 TrN [Glarea lozoyensis ATCC 20868]